MTSKMKMMGTSAASGIKTETWKINRTGVVVSRDNISAETGREYEDTVLHISFSHPAGEPPQRDIDYALMYFGFDVNRHYYSFVKPSYSPYSQRTINIYYYEQLQSAN